MVKRVTEVTQRLDVDVDADDVSKSSYKPYLQRQLCTSDESAENCF